MNTTSIRAGRTAAPGMMRRFEGLIGLPGNLPRSVPGAANRSPARAETEMLRNLDVEFRGNDLPDEPYSRPAGNGAVMHMKNTCSPAPRNVKILTLRRAVEAAAGIAAGIAVGTAEWIGASGVP
ncbi:hypothetical protein [Streptomyces sp. NPDC001508]|uniref:hypothetical protein n=1 Tax=Streptomyces sp. NPDC001508 TaxID=3154656 RepID=UPI0033170AC0